MTSSVASTSSSWSRLSFHKPTSLSSKHNLFLLVFARARGSQFNDVCCLLHLVVVVVVVVVGVVDLCMSFSFSLSSFLLFLLFFIFLFLRCDFTFFLGVSFFLLLLCVLSQRKREKTTRAQVGETFFSPLCSSTTLLYLFSSSYSFFIASRLQVKSTPCFVAIQLP